MVLWMGVLEVAPALAGALPSRRSDGTEIATLREADLAAAQRVLENKWVAQRLREYGMEPAEVQAKLADLSDAELHQLAAYSDRLPSGGDALGVIISLLVIFILVIIVLKLMNKEIVVK
jgi:hypothetical protein